MERRQEVLKTRPAQFLCVSEKVEKSTQPGMNKVKINETFFATSKGNREKLKIFVLVIEIILYHDPNRFVNTQNCCI